MDALLKFIGDVYAEVGLIGTVALLIAAAIVFPAYHAYKKWIEHKIANPTKRGEKKEKKRIDLQNAVAFSRIESLVKYTIPRLRIYCPVRKAVFQDILIIELNSALDHLKRLVARGDIDDMTPEALHTLFEDTIQESFLDAECRINLSGIPMIALEKFRSMNDQNEAMIKNVMNSITHSTTIFDSNTEKVAIILDMIAVIASTMLVAAEQAIDDLNGELSAVVYKGYKCAGDCKDCRYINQNKHTEK